MGAETGSSKRGSGWRKGLVSVLAAWLAMPGATLGAESRTWIVGATVLSPERKDSGRLVNVLIEGERIATVSADLPPNAQRGADMVDARGAFLIPGLIDSHVHLSSVPGMDPIMQYLRPTLVRAYTKQMPRSYLRYGYTTVIDLTIVDRYVFEDFLAAPAHPDLYHCGDSLPVANGYPSTFAPRFLRDWFFPNYLVETGRGSDPEHAPPAAVARVKANGGICVKTYFERGYGRDHDLPVLSAELFGDIVKAAHGAGLPVLLHASSLDSQRFGVEGGTDVFVHGMWNWDDHNASPTLPEPVREVLDEIAVRRIGYMPTLQALVGSQLLFEPDYLNRPEVHRVVPKALLEWYGTSSGRWWRDELAGGQSDEQVLARYDAMLLRGSKVTAFLAQRDAFFLFGTDTPAGPTYGNLPGLNGYLEMQRLVAAGMTLRQLFEAATINNARTFGLADRIGTIEPGKRANLLLLNRSPLESVEAYDAIRAVWIGGQRPDLTGLEAAE